MKTPKARTIAYAVFSKLLLASAFVAGPLLAAEGMSGSQQRDREAVLIANRVQASAGYADARYADSSTSAENSNRSRRDSNSGDNAEFKKFRLPELDGAQATRQHGHGVRVKRNR